MFAFGCSSEEDEPDSGHNDEILFNKKDEQEQKQNLEKSMVGKDDTATTTSFNLKSQPCRSHGIPVASIQIPKSLVASFSSPPTSSTCTDNQQRVFISGALASCIHANSNQEAKDEKKNLTLEKESLLPVSLEEGDPSSFLTIVRNLGDKDDNEKQEVESDIHLQIESKNSASDDLSTFTRKHILNLVKEDCNEKGTSLSLSSHPLRQKEKSATSVHVYKTTRYEQRLDLVDIEPVGLDVKKKLNLVGALPATSCYTIASTRIKNAELSCSPAGASIRKTAESPRNERNEQENCDEKIQQVEKHDPCKDQALRPIETTTEETSHANDSAREKVEGESSDLKKPAKAQQNKQTNNQTETKKEVHDEEEKNQTNEEPQKQAKVGSKPKAGPWAWTKEAIAASFPVSAPRHKKEPPQQVKQVQKEGVTFSPQQGVKKSLESRGSLPATSKAAGSETASATPNNQQEKRQQKDQGAETKSHAKLAKTANNVTSDMGAKRVPVQKKEEPPEEVHVEDDWMPTLLSSSKDNEEEQEQEEQKQRMNRYHDFYDDDLSSLSDIEDYQDDNQSEQNDPNTTHNHGVETSNQDPTSNLTAPEGPSTETKRKRKRGSNSSSSTVVRLYGLPQGTKPEHVARFFKGLDLVKIYVALPRPRHWRRRRGSGPYELQEVFEPKVSFSRAANIRRGRKRARTSASATMANVPREEEGCHGFSVYVQFSSSAGAKLATQRTGELIRVLVDMKKKTKKDKDKVLVLRAAVLVANVPKRVAKFVVKHLAIDTLRGLSIREAMTEALNQLPCAALIQTIQWTNTAQNFGVAASLENGDQAQENQIKLCFALLLSEDSSKIQNDVNSDGLASNVLFLTYRTLLQKHRQTVEMSASSKLPLTSFMCLIQSIHYNEAHPWRRERIRRNRFGSSSTYGIQWPLPPLDSSLFRKKDHHFVQGDLSVHRLTSAALHWLTEEANRIERALRRNKSQLSCKKNLWTG